nr:hypothetical protein [Tanacetum cinerariifolium]
MGLRTRIQEGKLAKFAAMEAVFFFLGCELNAWLTWVMAMPAASISVDSPEESYVDMIEIAQHGEAILGIQEHLLKMPTQEELRGLRDKADVAEVERVTLCDTIRTMGAVETSLRNRIRDERHTHIEIERQFALVQEELTQSRMSHRQDREDSKKLEDFMTSNEKITAYVVDDKGCKQPVYWHGSINTKVFAAMADDGSGYDLRNITGVHAQCNCCNGFNHSWRTKLVGRDGESEPCLSRETLPKECLLPWRVKHPVSQNCARLILCCYNACLIGVFIIVGCFGLSIPG